MALSALPTFSCLPQDRGQHRTTTHLLPGDEASVLQEVQWAYADASAGRLPEHPTIEVYYQSMDPTLTGRGGAAGLQAGVCVLKQLMQGGTGWCC